MRASIRATVFYLAATASLAHAQPSSPTPEPVDTPAGKQFAAWLAALNTGERETIRRFLAEHSEKSLPVHAMTDSHVGLYVNDGRFDVRKVEASSPSAITALIEAKPTGYWVEVKVAVTAEPPHNIGDLRYQCRPIYCLPRS